MRWWAGRREVPEAAVPAGAAVGPGSGGAEPPLGRPRQGHGEPDVEPVRRGARGGQDGRRGERRAPRPAVPDGAGGPRLRQRLKAALLAAGS